MSASSKPKTVSLNVVKRDGTVQPFDKNKLVTSISKAGATQKQALLVSERVTDRLGGRKQPVPTSLISTMVARSLGQLNPAASGKYTVFRDQKLHSSLAPAAKGAVFSTRARIKSPIPIQPIASIPTPTAISTHKPDLMVTKLVFQRADHNFTTADHVTVIMTVKNQGTGKAIFPPMPYNMRQTYRTTVYGKYGQVQGGFIGKHLPGESFDYRNLPGGVTPEYIIQAGQEIEILDTPIQEGTLEAGTYTIEAEIDPENHVQEENRSNNKLSLAVYLGPPP